MPAMEVRMFSVYIEKGQAHFFACGTNAERFLANVVERLDAADGSVPGPH